MQNMSGTPASTADLKYSNRVQVLRIFGDGASHAAGDVAAASGLSRQTVMKAIQFFLRTGLLVSAGKGDSTNLGGKRPELFRLTRERYFLCITLWPSFLRIHLTTVGGDAVADLTRDTPLSGNAKEAIGSVGRLAAGLVRDSGVPMEGVCAVSISTAGIMDYDTGTLRYSSQSPDWGTDVPLAAWLRPWFAPGTLIFAENTGKMAARPLLLEPGLEDKRVMVIFSCWGLSSCLIDRGQILSGRNSLIGEIGHMTIDPEDPEPCGCGSRGCLERLVSVERIRDMARAEEASFPGSVLAGRIGSVTLPQVFEASGAGDGLARKLVDYLARCFATALRNVSLVFDPDLIVFQGDYAYADELFRQRLGQYIRTFQYFPAGGPFQVRYDRRDLTDMDTRGSYIALASRYFGAPQRYTE